MTDAQNYLSGSWKPLNRETWNFVPKHLSPILGIMQKIVYVGGIFATPWGWRKCKNSPLLPVLFSVFFSRTSLQSKRHIVERRIIAQNACFGARKCLLGVSFTLNHFWGFRVGKTPKFSTEIGIFHVNLKPLISQKRSQLGKKFQVFTIGNLGRSFLSAIFIYIQRHLAVEIAISPFPVW